jgi:hypothetical protein
MSVPYSSLPLFVLSTLDHKATPGKAWPVYFCA